MSREGIDIVQIKEKWEKQLSTMCDVRKRERGEETKKKASMISNASVIRSEAEVHYETPLRLYL